MKLRNITINVLLLSTLSFADGIKDFADGVIMSTTSSGSMSTKDRSVLYGGGVSIKAPLLTINPINVQPPSIKAGCGGIDLAFGSLSFLNKDQVVKFLEATMANAEGVAFDIAMKTLCPSCSETLKAMEAMANQINNMSLDGCQAANALLGKEGFDLEGKLKQEDVSNGAEDSWLSASAKAIKTGTEKLQKFNQKLSILGSSANHPKIFNYFAQKEADLSSLKERSLIGHMFEKYNITLLDYNIFATLIGDVIITETPSNEEGATGKLKFKYPLGATNANNTIYLSQELKTNTGKIIDRLIGNESNGGRIYVKSSSNRDYDPQNITDGNFQKGKLVTDIKQKLTEIITSITNREQISDDNLEFLGQFKTPVYPIFNTLGQNDLTIPILDNVKDSLATMLANQILYEGVTQLSRFLQEALSNLGSFNDLRNSTPYKDVQTGKIRSDIAMMLKNNRAVTSLIYKNYIDTFNKFSNNLSNSAKILKELQNIKNFTISRSNPEIFDNLIMSKAISGK